MKRRELLQALACASLAPPAGQAAAQDESLTRALRAAPATLPAAGLSTLDTWAFDGRVPGPVLRARRGEWFDLTLHNSLPDPTTIHWHGVRVPHPMDGVPHLTQPPVLPGETFRYRFKLPDAGTYWYHPHWGTPEQVERGLAGALVVEDDEPPPVDRDEVWLLDDWRIDRQGRIAGDFYDYMDVSHAGRLGSRLTVNGQPEPVMPLEAGQRLRLRLVNAANARIFALDLRGLPGWLIARDGVPADAAVVWEGPLLLGPGMRVDVIIDATAPGRHELVDRFGRGERLLGTLAVDGAAASRTRPPPSPARADPLPVPMLAQAEQHSLVFGGGMMSMQGWPDDPWTERAARRLRRLSGSREADPVWSVNGHAHMGRHDAHEPIFRVAAGRSVHLRLENRTAWWHPIHVHGHHVKLLARNGQDLSAKPWRDTVLLAPRDRVDVAFVADNPGRWLLHCHVLEHHAGGMGSVFDVVA